MIINNKVFKEVASKGVSQKTLDSWNESERADYLKRVPNSKYANPDNTLPTTIKSSKDRNFFTGLYADSYFNSLSIKEKHELSKNNPVFESFF